MYKQMDQYLRAGPHILRRIFVRRDGVRSANACLCPAPTVYREVTPSPFFEEIP